MNQFVPQLMLGNVLANSSNYPDYHPQWIALDQWHIGAQYFMALPCNSTEPDNDKPCWIPKAATGKLVQVEPGEMIETTFTLVQVSDETVWEWHLRIGVVGAHPSRWSMVVARQPFMGLVPGTAWQDDIYRNVTVGSCLENYGMTSQDSYPPLWKITMDVITTDTTTPISGQKQELENPTKDNDFEWDDWAFGGGPKCSWMPHSTLTNAEGSTWQRAIWTAMDETTNDNGTRAGLR